MRRTARFFALALVLALAAPGISTASQLITTQVPLSPSKIAQFVTPLPTHDNTLGQNQFVPFMLRTAEAPASQRVIQMMEFYAKVLPDTFYQNLPAPPGGAADGRLGTRVWGYRDYTVPQPGIVTSADLNLGSTPLDNNAAFNNVTYLGPTMLVPRGIHDNVWYKSRLGSASLLQKYVTVDQTLKWADPFGLLCFVDPNKPGCFAPYTGPVPVAVHFHGTESPGKFDGGPDEWFTEECGDDCKPGTTATDALGRTFNTSGPAFVTNQFYYENQQEPGTFFYHDHGLGITRTNVFSGLAAGYLILDNNTNVGGAPLGLATKPAVLNPLVKLPPFPTRWMPLVLQDRLFDTNGQFIFPDIGINPEHPFWLPEYFGNVIVVNGKAWPFLSVQPDQYRFSVVNGSNARVYNLFFTGNNAPKIWVIGTEQGYLDTPLLVPSLTIATGERYDIVIDFSMSEGKSFILRNDARSPFPNGRPVVRSQDGTVMEFRVAPLAKGQVPTLTSDALTATTQLRSVPMVNIRPAPTAANPAGYTIPSSVYPVRRLTLNEFLGLGGPLEMLVNNTKYATQVGSNPTTEPGATSADVSEIPLVGDTEIWEIINLTADTHPLHTHLTAFQLLDRQAFDLAAYDLAYNTANPAWGGIYRAGAGPPVQYGTCGVNLVCGGNPDPTAFYLGPAIPAAGQEIGWKDTVRMNPGEVTRILVRLAPTDVAAGTTTAGTNYYTFDPSEDPGYVWHCHIVDHEDNEMMRPFAVTCPAPCTPVP